MKKKIDKDESVVCEFFGIEITTKNPNIARILTTDIGEFLNKEITHIKEERQQELEDRPELEPSFPMALSEARLHAK